MNFLISRINPPLVYTLILFLRYALEIKLVWSHFLVFKHDGWSRLASWNCAKQV